MRILFIGTSSFAVPALEALAEGHEITAVITRQDKPAGRGLSTHASAVKQAAEKLGLTVFQPSRVSSQESLEELKKLSFDLSVVAAYGQLLSPAVLEIPPLGNINIHASLLPKYRGAAPIQRALMDGETQTGVSAMWMSPGLDEGDIIYQAALPIGPEETYGLLHDRLAQEGARLILETVAAVAKGDAPRLLQDNDAATFAPPLAPLEFHISWIQPAERIFNLVRALHPRPGAYSIWRGKRIKIWKTEKRLGLEGIPASIIENTEGGPLVAGIQGGVVLAEVQPEGRKRMTGAEFIRGYRPVAGEVLE